VNAIAVMSFRTPAVDIRPCRSQSATCAESDAVEMTSKVGREEKTPAFVREKPSTSRR